MTSWHRATLATLCLVLLAATAEARPPHKKALADYFGPGLARKLNDCRTCHVAARARGRPAEDKPHNAFGARLKAVRAELTKAGEASGIPERIEAIADEDSDGDGVANLLELLTGHFPGEADDTPGRRRAGRGRAAIAAFRAVAERVSAGTRSSRSSGPRSPSSRRGLASATRSTPSSPPSTSGAA